ncbi:hypothetical protein M911_05090 [Ectothiorhodospira haloalkaliphila]|uniref:Uncharacterized protein n=1 Tax=Ectothiorhodospira haloalkaliphila TaxID=421628 RepID=W8LA08_9GAMM|nr:hypothetical protein M911_05090 [Ectothiorhodospira haloalkaliphila]
MLGGNAIAAFALAQLLMGNAQLLLMTHPLGEVHQGAGEFHIPAVAAGQACHVQFPREVIPLRGAGTKTDVCQPGLAFSRSLAQGHLDDGLVLTIHQAAQPFPAQMAHVEPEHLCGLLIGLKDHAALIHHQGCHGQAAEEGSVVIQ